MAEGFAIVPREMLADSRLSGTDLRIYLVLASRANAHMECWPARKTIAADAAVSLSVAQRSLNHLRDLHYIQWEARLRDNGSLTSNVYRLGGVTPGVVDDTPLVSPTTPPRVESDTTLVSKTTPPEREPVQKNSSSSLRVDVEELLEHLEQRIEGNGSKRPVRGKEARDAMRLLLDNDHRTVEQVHTAIDWCQDDEFWRANVRSAKKLREQYDTLRLQAQRQQQAKEPTRRKPDVPPAPVLAEAPPIEDGYQMPFPTPEEWSARRAEGR